MIHYTENLKDCPAFIQLQVSGYKMMVKERNRMVEAIRVFDETINKAAIQIDKTVLAAGYTHKEIEDVVITDTCTLIDID